ncbi:MAG: cobalamin-dependent protein [Bacillota bacterium]
MARVILVEPKAPNFHVFSMVKLPRLGLPQLGAILTRRGHQVEIYLEQSGVVNPAVLLTADLVGISTTTSTAPEAYRLARFVRHHGVPVVLGGPHVTFQPEEALEAADYVVRGEGEVVFPELVERLSAGRPVGDLPGLSFIDSGRVVNNPMPETRVDLATLPPPDLGLIRNLGKLSVVPLMTSRGCPYSCNFCAVTALFGRRYRFAPTEQVLEDLAQYPGRRIFFYDDNFTADVDHSKALLEGMLRRGLTPPWWSAQVRVDAAKDPELMDLMARTNCAVVYVGLESVNPEALKAFHKGQKVEDIDRCLAEFHRRRIRVHGMFIFGADEDGPDVGRETVRYARAHRLDTAQFMALTPIPGTPLYDRLAREGRLLTDDWRLYDGLHAVHRPARLAPHEVERCLVRAYSSFYSWPGAAARAVTGDLLTAGYRAAGRLLLDRWLRGNPLSGPVPAARPAMATTMATGLPLATAGLPGLTLTVKAGDGPGAWHIEAQGVLDQSKWSAFKGFLVRTVRGLQVPGGPRLVINLSGLRLSGEVLPSRVGALLDGLAKRCREIKVVSPNAAVRSLLEHCRPGLPRYECL